MLLKGFSKWIVIAVTLTLLSSCAMPETSFDSFSLSSLKRLKFWKSGDGDLYAQHVINKVGPPHATSKDKINSQRVEQLSYFYADKDAKSAADDGSMGVQVQTFYTYAGTGKVFGKVFTSSFKKDSTYFALADMKKIKKGMTKKAVISRLGKPPGDMVTGTDEDTARHIYVYGYPFNNRGLVTTRILFDDDDKVLHVRTSTIQRFW